MYVRAEQQRLLDAASSSHNLSAHCKLETIRTNSRSNSWWLSWEIIHTRVYATYTSCGYYLRVALIRSELLNAQLLFQGGNHSRAASIWSMYLLCTYVVNLYQHAKSVASFLHVGPLQILSHSPDFPPQLWNKIWEWPGIETTVLCSYRLITHSTIWMWSIIYGRASLPKSCPQQLLIWLPTCQGFSYLSQNPPRFLAIIPAEPSQNIPKDKLRTFPACLMPTGCSYTHLFTYWYTLLLYL